MYQKPTIIKIDYTNTQKSGAFGNPLKTQKVRSEIDGVLIEELIERYGSPLFVFSQNSIEEKYQEFKQAFTSRYPEVEFWWSYKTNYLDAICQIYHNLGSKAEVVSAFEYDKARRLGIPGKDIIFNGPYKPKEALKKAVQEGAKIHIDHWYEINDLEAIADELGIEIPVAIRCNMNTGIYPQWSRFGFNIDNGEAYDAIERIYEGKKLYITGLHAHIGTFMLSAHAYAEETKKLIELKNRISTDFGYEVEYIDIGGGFASKNRLKGIYQPPEVVVPTPDEYAEAVTGAIFEYNEGNLPKLFLETGRALIDEAGYLLTSVFAAKRLPDGKKSYIVDAGVNLLYTAFWYNFDIVLDKRYEGLNEPSQINGPLCMNIDTIAENIMLPPLPRGSILSIWPVGAYNITQSMQFIQYRPRVVLIDKEGSTHLIREADDLEYVREKEIPLK
ncbi:MULTISPECIES: alanine racemase [unclassified Nitratiruptor]|uniref:alanine racemase n=1 Tax=unclassified Nitratiruptor TaxID=2624044 RepID=UPI001915EE4F|nr:MULTISPECIES: alanine racemase [unclassified Nitratiruptor]BCD59799.1 diaminopimelate decarboxylase [Nitratiruptor sp. YY08-10]BCD63723.1 diaminopimelate decarboxylase [Nitratiruptor sp. YY08-14]